MKPKTITVLTLLLFLATSAVASNGLYRSIKAESKGGEIEVVWKTSGDAAYHTYEVERRSNEVPAYRRIATVNVRGSGGTYSYVDNGAFFRTDAEKEFTYRIRAIGNSGTEEYSPPVTVSHKVVSSVKRSWGMIKELFR